MNDGGDLVCEVRGLVAGANEKRRVSHEGDLRLREVDDVFEVLADAVLMHTADDADDGGPRPAFVRGDEPADWVEMRPIMLRHLRIENGDASGVYRVGLGKGS